MRVAPFDLPVDEIRRSLDGLRRPLRVAVIRARNAFNVGAIIRVAHSFLVNEIILIGRERYYERAAMGMARYENLVAIPDEDAFIELARERGWRIVAFERERATVGLWRAELPGDCVMVFGSESAGVPQAILDAAEMVVGIPMYGINNSFPVAVAAGIAMAEWTRRHYGSGPS